MITFPNRQTQSPTNPIRAQLLKVGIVLLVILLFTIKGCMAYNKISQTAKENIQTADTQESEEL